MKDVFKQVLAGLILLAIPTIAGYFLGWGPWFFKTTPVYNWLLLLVAISLLSCLLIFFYIRCKPPLHKKQAEDLSRNEDKLDRVEEAILLFIGNNGKPVSSSDLASKFVSLPPVKLEYHVERLRQLEYLRVNVYMEKFFVLQDGREYLIRNGLI